MENRIIKPFKQYIKETDSSFYAKAFNEAEDQKPNKLKFVDKVKALYKKMTPAGAQKIIQAAISSVAGFIAQFKEKAINIGPLKKIGDKYIGNNSWYYNTITMANNKTLPNGVQIEDYSTTSKTPPPAEEIDLAKMLDKAKEMELPAEEEKPNEGLVTEAVVGLYSTNPNVENVNNKELVFQLELMYATKERAGFIWGAPGIGKTDTVRQVAQKNHCVLVIINLALLEPTDLVGLPYADTTTGTTKYYPPAIFPRPEDGSEDALKPGILFFDELNRAHPSVLKAGLSLLLDKKLNEYVVPKNWWIVAAGNRPEEADVTDLEAAVSGRLAHYNLVTTVEDWERWAKSEKPDETKEYYISDYLLDFLKTPEIGSQYFHKNDTERASNAGWANPRNWAIASRRLHKAEETAGRKLSRKEMLSLLSSDVSLEAASAFLKYYDLASTMNMADIEKVYTDPDNAPLPRKQQSGNQTLDNYIPDEAAAFMTNILALRKGKTVPIPEYANLIKFGLRLESPEYATALMKRFLAQHPYIHKAFQEENVKYNTVKAKGEKPVVTDYPIGAAMRPWINKYGNVLIEKPAEAADDTKKKAAR